MTTSSSRIRRSRFGPAKRAVLIALSRVGQASRLAAERDLEWSPGSLAWVERNGKVWVHERLPSVAAPNVEQPDWEGVSRSSGDVGEKIRTVRGANMEGCSSPSLSIFLPVCSLLHVSFLLLLRTFVCCCRLSSEMIKFILMVNKQGQTRLAQ